MGARGKALQFMRELQWNRSKHDGHLRGRLYRLAGNRNPWWDWGHPVMTLVGTSRGGNSDTPTPPSLWYREQGRKLIVARSYDELTGHWAKDPDHRGDWHWIGWGQDDDLRLGYYESGAFYGLGHGEQRLLLRWLLRWRLLDWFGLRTAIYRRALHAAVYQRKPFSCQIAPVKGSGGYDHWLCQLKRNHDGPHRYRGAQWNDGKQVAQVNEPTP